MKAIVVSQSGGPEVLEYQDWPEPAPLPDELLIDVAGIGVNFIDTYHRSGIYSLPHPFVPGLEGAGVVTSVGAEVGEFAVGDRVAWTGHMGSYAPRIALPADKAVRVPQPLSLHEAAGIMLQGLTALVHAAAGGVGLLLCQLLKNRGVTVVGTVSTAEKAQAASAAGATHIIRYDRDDLVEAVMAATEGHGVDVVYDGVGRTTFEAGLKCLKVRGMMAIFGQASGPVGSFDPQLLNDGGSLVVTRPSLTHFTRTLEELRWRSSEVFGDLVSGKLSLTIHDSYPLAEAARAHLDLESRSTSGKLLLLPPQS
jgi:NADPH2:quinone reductase